MKPLITFFLIAVVYTCSAQKVMIPYRSGNLFGLSDDDGKIIVEPQFEQVYWKQGTWFVTRKHGKLTDTLKTTEGRLIIRKDIDSKRGGLIHDGKIILNDEPFGTYKIIADKCIIAELDSRGEYLTQAQYDKYGNKRRLHSLFNLKGENVYPENFRHLEMIDTAGLSIKDKKTARYILFMAQDFDKKDGMFVFDADEQKITEWFVKGAYKIEGVSEHNPAKQITFRVMNVDGSDDIKTIDYTQGKFVLHSGIIPSSSHGKNLSRTKKDALPEPRIMTIEEGLYESAPIEAAPPDEKGISPEPAKFNPYFIFARDTLYYLTSYQDKHPVKLSAGGQVILMVPGAMTQYQPVIVKSENHFYIVKEGKPSTTAYDSLIYFGNYFLAWKTINGQMKAGVVTANDSAVVPFNYDFIFADIKLLKFEYKNPARSDDYQIVLKEADSKYEYGNIKPYNRSYSPYLTVAKNGKWGVISMKGETIIPMEYELIARNNMESSKPREYDYLILKKNGHYGMARLQSGQDKQQLSFIIEPILEYVPTFFYPDYFGQKGYRLIGLYDEHNVFKGYTSGAGKPFYKD